MMEYREGHYLSVRGRNTMITAVDEIVFEDLDGGQSTRITYQADITLNCLLCCCECLIRKDLEQLAKYTEEGMKEKCR